MSELLISETFSSRQGEGKLTGKDSFFIRTSGCNLRCWFCDTPYASWKPSGQTLSVDKLIRAAEETGYSHVVLTGGEPLLPAAASVLCDAVMRAGMHLTIETAGTIEKLTGCDLLSLSPKLSDSAPNASDHARWNRLHNDRRLPIETMRRLIDDAKDFQLKFVVGTETPWEEIVSLVDQLGVTGQDVFIMPQATTIEELDAAAVWLRPIAESNGYQYCDRMQIRWFGNRRGT